MLVSFYIDFRSWLWEFDVNAGNPVMAPKIDANFSLLQIFFKLAPVFELFYLANIIDF